MLTCYSIQTLKQPALEMASGCTYKNSNSRSGWLAQWLERGAH